MDEAERPEKSSMTTDGGKGLHKWKSIPDESRYEELEQA
jgi:hypothetical protein